MLLTFAKYQGTGNDFIIIDARGRNEPVLSHAEVSRLCDRRFGIGGDGLILLREHRRLDFRMIYYNADGNPGTMCGNGGRCIVAFARKLKIINDSARFEAADGIHEARINKDNSISLGMKDVTRIGSGPDGYLIDTGSPHLIVFSKNIDHISVQDEGRKIRYSTDYLPGGINVNFVEPAEDEIYVRTYERGVEDETLSCGTGIVASAICAGFRTGTDKHSWPVRTRGGRLEVRFIRKGDTLFGDIQLIGPAELVFEGSIEI